VSRWSRFVNTFRVERITQEIDDELALHVEEGVHAGRTPSDAAHAFGSSLHYREETRDIRIVIWLAEFVQDVRFGVRMLRRNAGFSLLAILCLTVGIGANAAVFSWIEGILLRPYPLVADQDRLFAVTGTERGSADPTDMSWPDFLDLERNCTLVEAFIAEKITGTTLSIGDRAERAPGSIVSANYFDALGVHPILGRGFRPDENTGRNAHPVTVISYQMWQERFHGDPAVVGKTQILNGLPHTIVGVAPQGFYGTFVGCVSILGARVDATAVQRRHRQARRPRGAMD